MSSHSCLNCPDWNKKQKCCDFNGICEMDVPIEYLKKQEELMYGPRDLEENL